MTFDVVQAVREGEGRFEWSEVESEHNGNRLRILVFRDAMKFDGVPKMRWDFTVLDPNETYDGVRLPATALQLQQIADLLGCLLLTPKVVDLIWLQAQLRFNPVCNLGPPTYQIAAISNITDIHQLIEKEIEKAGGDPGNVLVACVGKYWVLVNALAYEKMVHGALQCFNYGWPDARAPRSRRGVTEGVYVWQTIGGAHNLHHFDPSQTIRLMYKWAKLLRAGAERWEDVLLADVLQDPELAPLASHEGVLQVLRQSGVEPEKELAVYMPMMEIVAERPQGGNGRGRTCD